MKFNVLFLIGVRLTGLAMDLCLSGASTLGPGAFAMALRVVPTLLTMSTAPSSRGSQSSRGRLDVLRALPSGFVAAQSATRESRDGDAPTSRLVARDLSASAR